MTNHPNRNWRARMRADAARYGREQAVQYGSLPESHFELGVMLENAYRAGATAEHERMTRNDQQ